MTSLTVQDVMSSMRTLRRLAGPPIAGWSYSDTPASSSTLSTPVKHFVPPTIFDLDDQLCLHGELQVVTPNGAVTLGDARVEGRELRDDSSSFSSGRPGVVHCIHRVPVPAGDHRAGGALIPAVSGSPTATSRSYSPNAGSRVDHVTVYRRVQRFTPLFADAARPCRHAVGERWYVDETYVKVAGWWRYVYRAIDQHGQIIDVFVSPRRDTRSARRFFLTALRRHGEPMRS